MNTKQPKKQPGGTKASNFRLPPETLAQLDAIGASLGFQNRTAVIVWLAHQRAKKNPK